MKNSIYIIVILLTSCMPPMHTGPDPHSIDFDKKDFEEIRNELVGIPGLNFFGIYDPPLTISKKTIDKMEDIGFMHFYRFNNEFEIFICGYGILDQGGWGFIHGKLDSKVEETPFSIPTDSKFLRISYLGPLEDNWFRFAGYVGQRFNNDLDQ